jgi:hypothetical protein
MLKDLVGLLMAITASGPLARCDQLTYEYQPAFDVLSFLWVIPVLLMLGFVVWSPLLILLHAVFGRK